MKNLVLYFSVYGTAKIVAKEIAKLDGTKKYYHADEEQVEKYATMHLPFEG